LAVGRRDEPAPRGWRVRQPRYDDRSEDGV